MPIARPSPEHMEHVLVGMRETIRARSADAPDPVNLDAALSLYEPAPLVWGGRKYSVRQISYREGLRLQRFQMRFRALSREAPANEADLDRHEQVLEEILDLFWSFLDPKPSRSPFLDLAPLEVGALAGFFSTCLRIQNLPSRMTGDLRSPTTT